MHNPSVKLFSLVGDYIAGSYFQWRGLLDTRSNGLSDPVVYPFDVACVSWLDALTEVCPVVIDAGRDRFRDAAAWRLLGL